MLEHRHALPSSHRRSPWARLSASLAGIVAVAGAGVSLALLAAVHRAAAEGETPDLVVTLRGPAAVAPGGTLRYRVGVTNTGDAGAPDVVVTATLPSLIRIGGVSAGGAPVSGTVGVVRWNADHLAVGAGRSFEITAHLPVSAVLGARLSGTADARTPVTETLIDDNHAAWDTDVRAVDLWAEIHSDAGEVRPGEALTHTVTLYNVSPAVAEGVAVTVTLGGAALVGDDAEPAGFARHPFVSGVRWTRDAVPGVWTGYVDLVTRVPRDTPPGGEVAHAVNVASRTVDGAPANNSATAEAVPVVVPDLWVTATGPAQAAPGERVNYSLSYGNRGPGAAPAPRITGTLPVGFSYVSALPPATVVDARTLAWDLGRLPAGDSGLVRLEARVAADHAAGGTAVHAVEIADAAPDAAPADNFATVGTLVVPGPPAAVVLDAPDAVPAGDGTVAITADVRDAAGNPAADGTVVLLDATLGQLADAMPQTQGGRAATTWRPGTTAGPARISARVAGATAARDVVVAPGLPASVRLEIVPAEPTVGQPVAVTAEVRDGFGNPVADGTRVVFGPAEGSVEPAEATTLAGRAATTWSNTRAGAATLTATAGTAVAAARPAFAADAAARVRLTVDQLELPVDDGRTTVWASIEDRFGNPTADGRTVTFAAPTGRFAPSSASVSGGLAMSTFSAGPAAGVFSLGATLGSLSGQASVALRPADLALSSVLAGRRGPVPGGQIQPGEPVTYTLGVRNHGLATARNLVVGATFEERVQLVGVSANAPIAPTQNVKPGFLDLPSQRYTRHAWSVPDIAEGGGVTLTLVARVVADADPAWTGFDTLFFRSAITTTTAEASPLDMTRIEKGDIEASDLFIKNDLDGGNSSIRAGGQLIYDISFGNLKSAAVARAVITSTLPAWATFDHWEPRQTDGLRPLGDFDAAARELRWAFDGPWRQNMGFRLWFDIAPDAPPGALLDHGIEIGAAEHDIGLDNNRALSGGVRLDGVNLRAGATGPPTIGPGETLAWQFSVHNATTHTTAPDVAVEASLPAGLAVARADPPPALSEPGRVRWLLEQPLAPGAEQRFALDLAVPADAPVGTRYAGAVDVASSQRDAFTGDNHAELETRVVPGAPAALTLTAGADAATACSDETVDLSVEVRDRGGNPVADGTPVDWAATAGTLSEPATTTVGGAAAVRFSPASAAGTARVTVRSGSAAGEAAIDMPAGPPGRLAVSANPADVPWDGQTEVSVVVADACGNRVADRWPIQLSAERGEWPGGGLTMALPTDDARVAATLRVGPAAGPLRVTAAFEDVRGETSVTVRDRPPPPSRWTVHLPWAYQRWARRR